MIYIHKIMTENVKIKANEIFNCEIQKKMATKLPTITVFSNRLGNDWNGLPSKNLSATRFFSPYMVRRQL